MQINANEDSKHWNHAGSSSSWNVPNVLHLARAGMYGQDIDYARITITEK
jgi:hypothetical protein